MCAIAGFIGKASRGQLVSMLDAMGHRGPDDRGFYIKGNVGLGHNRLPIIDLSKLGHQPMFDSERSVCVVLNGEIYNYLDLKKQLREYNFKSKTDTEVLLYAYKKWGFDCLQKLNGMFSFVIFDTRKNLLFGARDRLGEKPLKYYLDGGFLAFASEIKGLLPILKKSPKIDHQAIDDYLTLQYVPAPRTGIKKIYKLPPAHYFVFKDRKMTIKRYWSLDFSNKLSLSEREWEDLLIEKINDSVKDRMISDVPLGAFLSGGVDSSTVVAFMAKNSKKRIKTFSVGFDEPRFDETNYADSVARMYDTDHRTLRVTQKMLTNALLKLADHYDEPFADNSAIPTLILSKFARKEVTVALNGDGGDENFAGYDRYNVIYFSEIYKDTPKLLRNGLAKPFGNLLFNSFPSEFAKRAKTYFDTFELPFYKRYLYYRSFFSREEKYGIYSGEFKNRVRGSDTFDIYKSIYDNNLTYLDNALKFDISSYLAEDLLFKMDIASMAYALEVRSPFLNHELLELTAKMPESLKIKFFDKKHIFKRMLLKRGILPRNVIYRKKKGFVTPIRTWFKEGLRSFLLDQITSEKVKQSGIFDQRKLGKYVKGYYSSRVDYSNNIFALLSLSCWINKYF